MKNKNSLWNGRLFLEGMKETKGIAFVGFFLCFLALLFLYLGDYVKAFGEYYAALERFRQYPNLVLEAVLEFVFVPIFMIRLLGFTNKRRASDFYHAVPLTRSTIYITYFTVIIVWSFLLSLFLNGGIALIEYSQELAKLELNPSYVFPYRVSFVQLAKQILSNLAGVLLSMGAMSVSLALTGTTFTNVLGWAIVALVPRMILSTITQEFFEMVPFLPRSDVFGIVTRNAYHMLSGAFERFYILETQGVAQYKDAIWIATIYSAILGAVYMFVGGFLLYKRRSETAGYSGVNKVCQSIMRLSVSYTVGLSAVAFLASKFTHNEKRILMKDVGYVLTALAISVLVYFLVELCTTRKWKNVVNGVRGLPMLVLLFGLTFLGFVVSARTLSKNVPSRSEVTAVQLITPIENNTSEHSSYEGESKLWKGLMEKVTLTSGDAITLFWKQLDSEMTCYREKQSKYENLSYNDAYEVVFYQGDKSFRRILHFTENSCDKIQEYLSEAGMNVYDFEVPMAPVEQLEDNGFNGWCSAFGWDFSYYQIRALYENLREDMLNTTPPLTWFMGGEYNREGVFEFLSYYDENGEVREVPISMNTPKAMEFLVTAGNALRTDFDFDWFVKYMTEEISKRNATMELVLYTGEEEGILYGSYSWSGEYFYDMLDEQLYQLQDILSNHEKETVSVEGNLLCVGYKDIGGVDDTCHWYNLTDEEAAKIKELAYMKDEFQRYQYTR